jgi:hypothetical protein
VRERYVIICTALNYTVSPMNAQEGLGELTIEEFDELIGGYIERGGPDAVSFTAFGEVLADLEVDRSACSISLMRNGRLGRSKLRSGAGTRWCLRPGKTCL